MFDIVPDVMARLSDRVVDLRYIEGVADFTKLLQKKSLPQQTPAVHVVPTGIRGGTPDAASAVFTQPTTETISVILTIRSNDQAGERAMEQAGQKINAIINAIAGWAPNDEIGVFVLGRGTVSNVGAGAFVYTLEFSIADQLRITE